MPYFSILPIFFQNQDTFDDFGFPVFEPNFRGDLKKAVFKLNPRIIIAMFRLKICVFYPHLNQCHFLPLLKPTIP